MSSKKGDYDVGHYTLYFIMLMFFFIFMFFSIKSLQGENFLQATEGKTLIENMITFDRLGDLCFAPVLGDTKRVDHTSINLKAFTDDTLAKCIPASARLTLANLHTGDVTVVNSRDAKEQGYVPDVMQKTFVVVGGEPHILTMEISHA